MAEERERGIRPSGWQAQHAQRYVETSGAEGHMWYGVPTLLLTTTGRRTGEPYTTPLIYGRDGDRYIAVATSDGAPLHPHGYLIHHARPGVEAQVLAERF